MAMTVREIQEWLKTLKPTDRVGVDDGGLCLCVVGDEEPYLEIGGLPADDDAAETGDWDQG